MNFDQTSSPQLADLRLIWHMIWDSNDIWFETFLEPLPHHSIALPRLAGHSASEAGLHTHEWSSQMPTSASHPKPPCTMRNKTYECCHMSLRLFSCQWHQVHSWHSINWLQALHSWMFTYMIRSHFTTSIHPDSAQEIQSVEQQFWCTLHTLAHIGPYNISNDNKNNCNYKSP